MTAPRIPLFERARRYGVMAPEDGSTEEPTPPPGAGLGRLLEKYGVLDDLRMSDALRESIAPALQVPRAIERARNAPRPDVAAWRQPLQEFKGAFRNSLVEGNIGAVGETLEALDYEGLGGRLRAIGEGGTHNPRVGGLREIRRDEGAGNFVLDALNFGGSMLGQGVGSIAMPIAGGVAGGLIAGPPGAAVGTGIGGFTLGVGEARPALRAAGVEGDAADDLSLLAGVPIAALERLVPGRVAGRILNPGSARAATRHVGGAALRDAGQEGLTEMLQDAFVKATVASQTATPESIRGITMGDVGNTALDLVESGLAGALTGGFVGGGSAALQVARTPSVSVEDRLRNALLTEPPQLPDVPVVPDVAPPPPAVEPTIVLPGQPAAPAAPVTPPQAAPVAPEPEIVLPQPPPDPDQVEMERAAEEERQAAEQRRLEQLEKEEQRAAEQQQKAEQRALEREQDAAERARIEAEKLASRERVEAEKIASRERTEAARLERETRPVDDTLMPEPRQELEGTAGLDAILTGRRIEREVKPLLDAAVPGSRVVYGPDRPSFTFDGERWIYDGDPSAEMDMDPDEALSFFSMFEGGKIVHPNTPTEPAPVEAAAPQLRPGHEDAIARSLPPTTVSAEQFDSLTDGADEAFHLAAVDYITGNSQESARRAAAAFSGHDRLEALLGPTITVYRSGPLRPGKLQSFSLDKQGADAYVRHSGAPVVAYQVRPQDVAFPGATTALELVIDGGRVTPLANAATAPDVAAVPSSSGSVATGKTVAPSETEATTDAKTREKPDTGRTQDAEPAPDTREVGPDVVDESPSERPAAGARPEGDGRPEPDRRGSGRPGDGDVRRDTQRDAGTEPTATGRDRERTAPDEPVSRSRGDSEPGTARAGSRDAARDGERVRVDDESAAGDFRIPADAESVAPNGAKTRARANIAAIKVLRTLQQEGRRATLEEQQALVQYVGWGGIPNIFDPEHKDWTREHKELRELLSDEEWDRAKASTLNAHYTSLPVIRQMYAALDRLGVKPASTGRTRILETSAGVGHFLGLTPEGLDAQWTAVELDAITGGILRALYPEADTRVHGFEKLKAPDGTFDLVVGNVPFGDYRVSESRYDKHKLNIHDHFILKALDLTRPGGVVAVITTNGTMDKQDSSARKLFAERANLLGAIRLPNNAFKGNAATEVVTDILFFQRRAEGERQSGNTFQMTTSLSVDGQSFNVNNYFVANPDMVIGEHSGTGSMYRGGSYTVEFRQGPDAIPAALAKAIERLPEGVYQPQATDGEGTAFEDRAALPPEDMPPEGTFVVAGDNLSQVVDGRRQDAKVPKAHVERIKALASLRDGFDSLVRMQLDPEVDEKAYVAERTRVKKAWQAFVKQYGPINRQKVTQTKRTNKEGEPVVIVRTPNLQHFTDDPRWPSAAALEVYDPDTDKATPADILERRVMAPPEPPGRVERAADAIPLVLNERGRVDIERIMELRQADESTVVRELEGVIYRDPATGKWEMADAYLSGDVRRKLAEAREAAKKDPALKHNVEALEAAQPTDLKPSEIGAAPGAPWIPTTDYEDFLRSLLGEGRGYRITYLAADATWKVEAPSHLSYGAAATAEWGTPDVPTPKLLELTLNGTPVRVTMRDRDGKTHVLEQETAAALAKQEQLRAKFETWIWEDPDRAARLGRTYNDRFNNLRARQFEAEFLTLPGVTTTLRGRPFAMRRHQKAAIWRGVTEGNVLLDHVVGSGKTFTMVGIAMERKRLGLSRKPTAVVPNHLLYQFAREAQQMYPGAKILVATKDDLKGANRDRFLAMLAGNDWDMVVFTHRQFEDIKMSAAYQEDFMRRDIRQLEAMILETKKDRGDRATIKELEKAKKRRETKLASLLAADKKRDYLEFEETGIDYLLVDEAHVFKNLEFYTKLPNLGGSSSQRAFDMYLKTRYLNERTGEQGITFATGTPVSNSIAEAYTMERYMAPLQLESAELSAFDAWAATFADAVTEIEAKPEGGYHMKTRFARFKNVPELLSRYRQFADVQTNETLPELAAVLPAVIGGKAEIIQTPVTATLKAFMGEIAKRADMVRSRQVTPKEDNLLAISTDGRLVALDPRLRLPDAEDEPGSKLRMASEKIAEIHEETAEHRGTQLVFMDFSKPGGEKFSAYDELKRLLVEEHGIPAAEVRFIHEANTDAKKAKLFADVNAGRVRVLLGSTEKMGAGTNVQQRAVAMHHLDAPWRPSDVEQRDGRIIRQGNMLYNSKAIEGVRVLRYVTKGSFDLFMWQTLDRKARSFALLKRGDLADRTIEDVGDVILNADEAKAAAAEDPRIVQKAQLDHDVQKLRRQRRAHQDEQVSVRTSIAQLPGRIEEATDRVAAFKTDLERRTDTTGEKFSVKIGKQTYTDRTPAAEALKQVVDGAFAATLGQTGEERTVRLGEFAGFPLIYQRRLAGAEIVLRGEADHAAEITADQTGRGLLSTVESIARRLEAKVEAAEALVARLEGEVAHYRSLVGKKWEHEARLEAAEKELADLNKALLETYGGQGTAATEGQQASEAAATSPEPAPSLTPDENTDRLRPGYGGGTMRGSIFGLDIVAEKVADAIRQARANRRHVETAVIESVSPEVEAAMTGAEGLPKGQGRDIVRGIYRAFRRHFQHLDPNASPMMAEIVDILRVLEAAPEWARVSAAGLILDTTKGLDKAQVRLMTRVLITSDLQRDVERGVYGEIDPETGETQMPLPFGLTLDVLEADHARYTAAAKADPKVQAALEKRRGLAQAVTRALVDRNLLPAEVLDDSRYFHRQVIHHWQERQARGLGTSPKDVRVHRKGFQRARVGSGSSYNTSYVESEYEWLAQAYSLIATKDALSRIKVLADVRPGLERQAKRQNLEAFYDSLSMDLADVETARSVRPKNRTQEEKEVIANDPLEPYRRRIARGLGGIRAAANAGTLDAGPFEHVAQALANGPADAHPQFMALLSWIAGQEDHDQSMNARMVFKAIVEREQTIREELGSRYQTWEDLVPDGYSEWQPEQGNHFYVAASTDRTLAAVVDGSPEMEVRSAPKETWVIPSELAATMDEFRPHNRDQVDDAWRAVQSTWKQWTLINPSRWARYNLNNFSGDLDILLAYDPAALKHFGGAVRDLWDWKMGKASPAVVREMLELVRLGALNSGFEAVEIPDLHKVGAFRGLTGKGDSMTREGARKVWSALRESTNYRENLLRLVAYRHIRAQLEAGKDVVGASTPGQVRALKNLDERAAKISRELIGDYGNLSVAGQWIRARLVPFYSWLEINAPRYVRLIRNSYREGDAAGVGRGVAMVSLAGGKKVAVTVLQANLIYAAAAAWNASWRALFGDDEEDDLREMGRSAHLILGRTVDGRIRTLRLEGALADALDWFKLGDWPADLKDLSRGDQSVGDIVADMAKAPIERVLQGWEPVSKTVFETTTGRSIFPRVWESGATLKFAPRPLRDRAEHVAGTLSLQWLYRRVTGRPKPPGSNNPANMALSLFTYTTDPGQAAYWEIRHKARKWVMEQGRGSSGGDPTDRSTALAYYRQAVLWGDERAARKWYARYEELGGSRKGLSQSIRMNAPLGGLSEADRFRFRRSLSDHDRRALESAEQWYRRNIRPAGRAPKRAPPKPKLTLPSFLPITPPAA